MSTVNEEVLRRFYREVMGRGDLESLHELVAEDFTDHGEAFMGSPQSRDELEAAISGMHTFFPDFDVSLEDVIVDGNLIGVRGTMRCHQQGDFMGVPATGNELSWSGLAIFEIVGGTIRRRWFNSDSLSIVQQLGVVPTGL